MEGPALSISSTRFWMFDSESRRDWKKEVIRGRILPRCCRPVLVRGALLFRALNPPVLASWTSWRLDIKSARYKIGGLHRCSGIWCQAAVIAFHTGSCSRWV